MIIGINASMLDEMEFAKTLPLVKQEKQGCFEFLFFEYNGHTLIASVCGTGKVSAAANAQTLILAYKPDLMINMGTAGAVSFHVKNNDVVVATQSVQHDFNVSEFGFGKYELVELGKVYLECDEKFVNAARKVVKDNNLRAHFGTVCSGDHLILRREQREHLIAEFDGYAGEMEGAAVGEVCALNGVNYALLKGISDGDSVGENASEEFRSNIGSVAEILTGVFLKVLEEI
ncbi:MAG: 5'-methylthioadenosine/S-adenosylhomocysteine nucleosidase [Anaerofustis stercorihominis]|nr:5'-methylthioadenosine/S-adenosylhomocysteine nucleosidase [Anaerofustis stercorihominis]